MSRITTQRILTNLSKKASHYLEMADSFLTVFESKNRNGKEQDDTKSHEQAISYLLSNANDAKHSITDPEQSPKK